MRQFTADMHIHTALSPCSSPEMTPPAIVKAAIRKGLAMIAICDHNATGNVAATKEAAGKIVVIAGMEITSAEDVHVLGLFPDEGSAGDASDVVKATLPDVAEAQRRFGDQLLMDARGEVIGEERKMLAASSTLNLSETVDLIRQHNGIAIAAHVDRPSFSVMSQLGFFPADVRFDAVEVSAASRSGGTWSKAEELRSLGLPVIASSDSHFLSDVGACCTVLQMLEPTFDELVLALRMADGRSCSYA